MPVCFRSSGWAEMIFVIGGCDKHGFSRLSFMEKLNMESREWLSANVLPGYSKSEFAACELQNDIYLSGITDVSSAARAGIRSVSMCLSSVLLYQLRHQHEMF